MSNETNEKPANTRVIRTAMAPYDWHQNGREWCGGFAAACRAMFGTAAFRILGTGDIVLEEHSATVSADPVAPAARERGTPA